MADTVKHTPGPWHVDPKAPEESFFEDVSILRHDGLAVAVAVHNGDVLPPEPEANARLIAAAPDLLAVAQKVVNNWGDLHHKDLMQLRAAIAKATGGQ